jgi:hypothetical protein
MKSDNLSVVFLSTQNFYSLKMITKNVCNPNFYSYWWTEENYIAKHMFLMF